MAAFRVQKDSESDASRLLDLGGLVVDRIELDTFGSQVVHLLTADSARRRAPAVGSSPCPSRVWCAPSRVISPTGQGFYG